MKRIYVLPDDVPLEIFDVLGITGMEAWQSLVHVCRRWRNLGFVSPRRLNLHLLCTLKTPVKDTLDVWPALPLIVTGTMALTSGMDNIIAALGQSIRVCQVSLVVLANSQLIGRSLGRDASAIPGIDRSSPASPSPRLK